MNRSITEAGRPSEAEKPNAWDVGSIIIDVAADENHRAAAAAAAAQSPQEAAAAAWVELTEGPQWSRLLYTNPVCFLGTCAPPRNDKNVMVLSWLTATNNDGGFVFSLCKRRHTASVLREGSFFTLSVPIRGMEELVRNVGSVSGRLGSKFPSDVHHCKQQQHEDVQASISGIQPPQSKRQKKKMLHQGFGVPGLESISIDETDQHASQLFAIRGTVAHLVCRVHRILDGALDPDHFLVQARVYRARVLRDYWDGGKNLFRPMSLRTAPYLTFFGSQTFGYVVSEEKIVSLPGV